MYQEQQKPRTWRELLNELSPEEKRRIIDRLGIQERTLERWIRGQTDLPHLSKLRQLLNALSVQTRGLFIEAVLQEPSFSRFAEEIVPLSLSTRLEIPSAFYARLMEVHVSTLKELRFTSISQLVMLQILQQLDLHHLGLCVIVLRCTPPFKGKVRSLYQQLSLGSFPWSNVVEQRGFFVGVESVVGQAVVDGSPTTIQNVYSLDDPDLISVHRDKHTASIAAFPIQKEDSIAGCLLVLSTQPNFFTPSRFSVLQQYSHLMVIGLNNDEFYERQQIDLQVLPSVKAQDDVLTQVRKRTSTVLKQAQDDGQFISWFEAEQSARQYIEAELLEKVAKG